VRPWLRVALATALLGALASTAFVRIEPASIGTWVEELRALYPHAPIASAEGARSEAQPSEASEVRPGSR
jgi:hypothetical protein